MKKIIGSCNGCGLCCKTLVLPVPNETCVRRDYDLLLVPRLKDYPARTVEYFKARGIVLGARSVIVPIDPLERTPFRYGHYRDGLVVFIKHRCPLLGLENECTVHGTLLQPRVCREYPTVLDDLEIVRSECGYQLVEVEDVVGAAHTSSPDGS
jgi:Fe-S-cluster containining protein